MFLLTRIDLIVHGQLYSYNLQFDHAWADPYWAYKTLIYISLGLPIALSAFAVALGFARKINKVPLSTAKQEPTPRSVISDEPKSKDNKWIISCPSCKKVVSKPLVKLNFEGGKTRLVKVCPYCDYVLGSVEIGKSPENDVQIADVDKKLTH